MTKSLALTRRQFIQSAFASAIVARYGIGALHAEEPITVGFLYVGAKDDYGYNQSHAESAKIIGELPYVRLIEEERVPETVEVQKSMQSMIELDGAKVLFPTSYGYYDPHVLAVAEQYPDVTFFHCGGLYEEGQPANVGTYWATVDQAQYVSGVTAAHMTKTGKFGMVCAVPIPDILRAVNSFLLGARTVRPDATMQIIYTGDWNVPVKEAEAVNSLADQGIDVVGCEVDSPKVIVETADKRGLYSCGVYASQAGLGAEGFLVSAIPTWAPICQYFLDKSIAKEPFEHTIIGGMAEGYVGNSEFGPAVSDEAKAAAMAAAEGLKSGTTKIYQGPLKDNEGNVRIADGESYSYGDPFIDGIDWLVEGVTGSSSI
tara:strand:+ start:576 stop:1694 length:1119 start_codon:yes stop_codon:yes gene_type:complete